MVQDKIKLKGIFFEIVITTLSHMFLQYAVAVIVIKILTLKTFYSVTQ